MPIYTYKCSGCKKDFDEIVKYDDRKKSQECPSCNKRLGEFNDELAPFTYSLGRSFSRMREGM